MLKSGCFKVQVQLIAEKGNVVLPCLIFHCLYVYVLDSQTLMCLLVMIVVNDEVIHY